MKNNTKPQNLNVYYYVPALIAGLLTGFVLSGSFGYTLLGGILGLLAAGFWINKVEDRGE